MLQVIETTKSVEKAAKDFEVAASNHAFVTLASHDLRAIMKKKGVELGHDCIVYEICNAAFAKRALDVSMAICTAMPCRVAIYEEGGKTKISTLQTTALADIFGKPALMPVAEEIEAEIVGAMRETAMTPVKTAR